MHGKRTTRTNCREDPDLKERVRDEDRDHGELESIESAGEEHALKQRIARQPPLERSTNYRLGDLWCD